MTILEAYLDSKGVSIDTRTLLPGEMFVGIKGDNFDGNLYVEKALERGAKYAITSREDLSGKPDIYVVNDTLLALQLLATEYRQTFTIPIFALTGSNGKTTNKELLNSLLSESYRTHYTQGNLNNHIGLPLSILRMKEDTEIGIFELGANHKMEIENLCNVLKPTHGYITNIGKAHLEGFGSIEGVVEAKGELKAYLDENDGRFYVNNFEPTLSPFLDETSITLINIWEQFDSYMIVERLDYIKLIIQETNSTTEINTKLQGYHNEMNVLLNASVSLDLGISVDKIKSSLETFALPHNRFERFEINSNQVFLDAYNANPSSMKVSIDTFFEIAESDEIVLLVLGQMNELGKYAKEEHQKLVNDLDKKDKNKIVYLIGVEFEDCDLYPYMKYFSSFDELYNQFDRYIENEVNQSILIKGSRSNQLERLVAGRI